MKEISSVEFEELLLAAKSGSFEAITELKNYIDSFISDIDLNLDSKSIGDTLYPTPEIIDLFKSISRGEHLQINISKFFENNKVILTAMMPIFEKYISYYTVEVLNIASPISNSYCETIYTPYKNVKKVYTEAQLEFRNSIFSECYIYISTTPFPGTNFNTRIIISNCHTPVKSGRYGVNYAGDKFFVSLIYGGSLEANFYADDLCSAMLLAADFYKNDIEKYKLYSKYEED